MLQNFNKIFNYSFGVLCEKKTRFDKMLIAILKDLLQIASLLQKGSCYFSDKVSMINKLRLLGF